MSDEPILEPDTPIAGVTGSDLPVDADPADALDQRRRVLPDDEGSLVGSGLPVEADPADALDQRREVPLDDEADSLVGADPLVDDRKGFGDFPL